LSADDQTRLARGSQVERRRGDVGLPCHLDRRRPRAGPSAAPATSASPPSWKIGDGPPAPRGCSTGFR